VHGPIVVGTDGSETAAVAVMEAVELAKAFGLALHVVGAYHAHSLQTSGLPQEFEGLGSLSACEAVLEDIGSRIKTAGVTAELHAIAGDPADVLIEMAEKLHAGLIVVGNKGIGSRKRFLLGNVPSKVVHHAPCSTYIVHTT
jgi:nucleotide-binding universal stress UspA family protein